MFLGAFCLKRVVLLPGALVLAGFSMVACGSGPSIKLPPSGLSERVLASQGVSTPTVLASLFVVNVPAEAPVRRIAAGTAPGLMAISSDRATVMVYDSGTGSIQVIDTTKESNTGSIPLPGSNLQTPGTTISMVIPSTNGIGFVADPDAASTLWPTPGSLVEVNLPGNALVTQIGVPNAENVVSNSLGTQLLVFSGDSDSVSVISPANAVTPVDQGCNTAPNSVCTVIPGFDRPVFAIISGTTAYVFNCGAECGGTQASIQTLNLSTLTVGAPLPVNGATWGLLVNSTLYVAGTGTATGTPCASIQNATKTQATYCGTLDIVDLNTMTDPYFNNPSMEIGIPDGYHDRIDLSLGGKLFVGSYNCTNVGNVNNPVGEVRGCLAIYDTTQAGNLTAFMPPVNGDVTGLQGFQSYIYLPEDSTSYSLEYVAQNGDLWVYNTQNDQLIIDDILTTGILNISGDVIDVKAIDFF
jgi:hypothetical protein